MCLGPVCFISIFQHLSSCRSFDSSSIIFFETICLVSFFSPEPTGIFQMTCLQVQKFFFLALTSPFVRVSSIYLFDLLSSSAPRFLFHCFWYSLCWISHLIFNSKISAILFFKNLLIDEFLTHIMNCLLFFFFGTAAWTQGLHLESLHQPYFCEGFFEIRSCSTI
jgi:hypothetical protein